MSETQKVVLTSRGLVRHFYKDVPEESIGDDQPWPIEEELIKAPFYPYILHDVPLELEAGLKMKHVFAFLNQDLEYWQLMVGNWVEDYVKQSFEPAPAKNEDGFVITTLFTSIYLDSTCKDKKLQAGFPRVLFGAEGLYKDTGKKTEIGFGNTHMAELNEVPVEMRNDINVEFMDFDLYLSFKKKSSTDKSGALILEDCWLQKHLPWLYFWILRLNEVISTDRYSLGECNITLFQFIYAIFWELGFHGGPENRHELMDTLKKALESVSSP